MKTIIDKFSFGRQQKDATYYYEAVPAPNKLDSFLKVV